jgi:2-polyprenyl-3-methyl-5-hydroxy-6-metoxy-1,4-benzoquinol methylase
MSQEDFLSTPESARTLSLSATPKPQQPAEPQRKLNKWRQAMQDPTHSERYAQRWERLEAAGEDIDGEARAIDAIADRESTILDAGAGNGRVAGYLAAAGHDVTGIDLDPHLVQVANVKYPQAHFEVADLADFALRDDNGQLKTFDIIVSAGNVQAFLADWERVPALVNVAQHMHEGSRFVTGFQLTRGYSNAQFTDDAQAAGLEVYQRFGTWQFKPFSEDGEFLLAVARRLN